MLTNRPYHKHSSSMDQIQMFLSLFLTVLQPQFSLLIPVNDHTPLLLVLTTSMHSYAACPVAYSQILGPSLFPGRGTGIQVGKLRGELFPLCQQPGPLFTKLSPPGPFCNGEGREVKNHSALPVNNILQGKRRQVLHLSRTPVKRSCSFTKSSNSTGAEEVRIQRTINTPLHFPLNLQSLILKHYCDTEATLGGFQTNLWPWCVQCTVLGIDQHCGKSWLVKLPSFRCLTSARWTQCSWFCTETDEEQCWGKGEVLPAEWHWVTEVINILHHHG